MNDHLPRMYSGPRAPINLDEVADWHDGSDLSWNLEQRADALADLALRTAGDDPARAQVYATLALDQRTAAAAAAWPGFVDSVNGTLDAAAATVAEQVRKVGAAVDDIRPRTWRRIVARYLCRRPASG